MANQKPTDPTTLAGATSPSDKSLVEHTFPVRSMDEMLSAIRRAGGTGKLEVNFRNGHARGEAKWKGFSRPSS
jgi:hypothetical protein